MQLAKHMGKAQKRWVRGIQTRVDVTASMLGSMKVGISSRLLILVAHDPLGSQDARTYGRPQQHGSKVANQGVEAFKESSEAAGLAIDTRLDMKLAFFSRFATNWLTRIQHTNHLAPGNFCDICHHISEHRSTIERRLCLHFIVFDISPVDSHGHGHSHDPNGQRVSGLFRPNPGFLVVRQLQGSSTPFEHWHHPSKWQHKSFFEKQ
jgi:hypothetical protein